MPRSRRPAMTSHACRRADGSKPVVGSSRKSSSGSPTSASAKSSRRRCPPESARRARRRGPRGRRASSVASTGADGRSSRRRARRTPATVRSGLRLRTPAARRRCGCARRAAACAGPRRARDTRPRRGSEPLEDLDGRRLAGAVRAEEREDLAALHVEVDARARPRGRRSDLRSPRTLITGPDAAIVPLCANRRACWNLVLLRIRPCAPVDNPPAADANLA